MRMKPPIAKKVPVDVKAHGQTWSDEYAWLRNKEDPDVTAYLEAENRFTEEQLKNEKGLQDTLYEEMKSRIKEEDVSVPEPYQGYFYYWRTEAGKQYRVYCRKKGSLEAQEEVLLDENQLAEGKDYFDLGVFEISPDQNLLAYSVDENGSEEFTLFVKDLRTGELFNERIPQTYYSAEWAADNQTIFYTELDDNQRPYRVRRHKLGTSWGQDDVVYEEMNPEFFVYVSKSKDERYLFVEITGAITSECHILDARKPEGEFQLIQERTRGVEYSVEPHGDRLFVLTNDTQMNFRIAETPLSQPSKEHWKDFIVGSEERLLDDFEVFEHFLVVYERYQGLPQVRIVDLRTQTEHFVEFDEAAYYVDGGENAEYASKTFRFAYTSLVTPASIYDYDMETRQRTLQKRLEIPGGYDPALYTSERILAPSHDGKKIPISIVYRKDQRQSKPQPLYLTGYGSYGICNDAGFSSSRLSLLDRGFIYAIAHIRGGSELGRQWYEDGKFLKKQNTFRDFISCAEYLCSQGFSDPDHLSISGGSAGGMLIGATINQRPELFHAAVAKVPFVDVVNTMLDDSLPLTAGEYDEWGNPAQKEFFECMRSYSPYDNVEAKDYPHLLVTAGLNDPRVTYWEPAKWTAKLRAQKTDSHLLLLYTNMGAGHAGASGRFDALRETALEYAFLLKVHGLTCQT